MAMISDNLTRLNARINDICCRIGRDPDEIILIGVTKYADASKVIAAVKAGLAHIGENRVQDAQMKFTALNEASLNVRKHMIGHLQTNKVKQTLQIFDMIQSVDSIKLATAIELEAQKLTKNFDILIQVNTAGEAQKFGIVPEKTGDLISEILKGERIRIRGLMSIAPLTDNKEIVRKCFRDLRLLRDNIAAKFTASERFEMKYLSMGMSDDFEIALEEGANMIRIGRSIFHGE